MSRLALRSPFARDARPTCGVVALDDGCGVGVLRRLAGRAPLRSAIVVSAGAVIELVQQATRRGWNRSRNSDTYTLLLL